LRPGRTFEVIEACKKAWNDVEALQDLEAWKNRYNREKASADGAGTSDDVHVVDDVEDDEEDDEQKMSVPLTVTIGMLAVFIFMGALLFGVLEDWDWLTSAYCCFVTEKNTIRSIFPGS